MIIKEEKLNANDLKDFKYRVDYSTEYPGNFDDMISCAYNDANAICVRARMVNPKTGKPYMNDSQFYVVKNLDDFNTLRLCAYEYGYKLSAPNEIDWDNCYTVDIFYPDKAGSYRVIDKRKTESFDGKRKLRIARYNEFDNGKVLFNYDRMTIEDAEKLAKQKSIKDPTDIYYVKFDDIMNPTTDICWYQGKSYPSDKIDMINGEISIKENKNMVRKLKLRENAITDLKTELGKTDLYPEEINKFVDKIKEIITQRLDINIQDSKLTPIAKPKSSTAAKRNPNFLIGINKYGRGLIIGDNGYYTDLFPTISFRRGYHVEDRGVREAFEDANIWFEISPIDVDTYKRRGEISQSRKIDGIYRQVHDYKDPYTGKTRQLYGDEFDLYDTKMARSKYAKRLTDIRSREQYDEILGDIEDINDRIRNIDFGHPIFDSSRAVRDLGTAYKSMKQSLEYFENKLKRPNYQIDDWDMREIKNNIKEVNSQLRSIEMSKA